MKNIAKQISVLSQDKNITGPVLRKFLPENNFSRLPVLASAHNGNVNQKEFSNEREILYKLFFDMKKDVTELKKMIFDIIQNPSFVNNNSYQAENLLGEYQNDAHSSLVKPSQPVILNNNSAIHQHEEVEWIKKKN